MIQTTIYTYLELTRLATAFAQGKLNLLLLLSEGGLGKSRTFRAATGGARTIEGKTTAIELYRVLWECRDEPIVIDDVDRLYADPDSVRLLKLACQTEVEKRVSWRTATRLLPAAGVPKEFVTRSPIAIIANEFRISNANLRAIADRGLTVRFEPTPEEVHRQVGTYFEDAEVYEYVSAHLSSITAPSQRIYRNASEMRVAELDWRGALQQTWGANPALAALREVNGDAALKTQKERIDRWVEMTGKDRSSYYRLAERHPEAATLRHYGERPR